MREYIDGDFVVTEYDSGTVTRELRFTPAAPVASRTPISKREFLKLFTPDEYSAIKSAAAVNSTLDYYWQQFMLAEFIALDDPDIIGGINMLKAAGLIATGRADEILGA
jgi:hypothetical protein